MLKEHTERLNLEFLLPFDPTVLKGCRGIVFTHGVRMGRWAVGRKKFVRAVYQKL